MEGGKSIEVLSLVFTAGIAAGSLCPPAGPESPATLLLLLSLPCLFRQRLAALPSPVSLPLVLLTFLALGFFCAWTARMSVPAGDSPLWALPRSAVGRVREVIGGIPFRGKDSGALLLALLTGERGGLSAESVAAFRDSGASHILALSGLHMGIIYLLLGGSIRVIGNSPAARRIRCALILSLSLFFVLMTGASASIVRAFLFIAIRETLLLLGRPQKSVRVLCLALFIQLALNPSAIRSLGFQLSYLAMAGIFLLYPVLEKWYPRGPRLDPFRKIWSMAALSISCQVFTGPLVWYRFQTFPRYFLLTNLLALPLTTALMTVSVATVILSAAGLCPPFLIRATDGLCSLLLWILGVIAQM